MGIMKIDCLSIKYFNNESNYYILEVQDSLSKNIFIAKGKAINIVEGGVYEIDGEFLGEKFLSDFRMNHIRYLEEISSTSLIKFLSSSKFVGIGKALATKIVEVYGDETLKQIKNDPTDLFHKIDAIKAEQVEVLSMQIQQLAIQNELLNFFTPYFTINQIMEIHTKYQFETINKVKENPYLICQFQINFKQVDKFALEKIGIDKSSKLRIFAYIEHELLVKKYMEHTYVELAYVLDDLVKAKILDYEQANNINELLENGNNNIIINYEKAIIRLRKLEEAEKNIALEIKRMQKQSINTNYYNLQDIKYQEKKLGIEYNEDQQLAIIKALNNYFTIIVGGPGTGKTTVVNAIVRILIESGASDEEIILCAPTGKAANRMKEATGKIFETRTLHSLLKISATNYSSVHHVSKLKYRYYFIDEFSMVDTLLFDSFLKAIDPLAKVILIGDQNQLPSVGPGQILKDLITSVDTELIATLSKIQRQKSDSKIIQVAHATLNNKNVETLFENKPDEYFFIDTQEQNVENNITKITNRLIEIGTKIENIQIITSRKNGEYLNSTTKNLNLLFQNLTNNTNENIKIHKRITKYRINDRIIQNENNKQKEIFNGDNGKILKIERNKIVIEFEGQVHDFELSELGTLDLGYAITVHKSQGSEYAVVLLVINSAQGKILNRELLYTAITRAKEKLIILGDRKGIYQAVNQQIENRKTYLSQYIKETNE